MQTPNARAHAASRFLALTALALALAAPFGCSSTTDPVPAGASPDRGTCPGLKPSTGTPCTQEGLSCRFGKNATGCDSDDGTCLNGTWNVASTPGCAAPRDSGAQDSDAQDSDAQDSDAGD